MTEPHPTSNQPNTSILDTMSDAEAAAYIEAHHAEFQAGRADDDVVELEPAADVSLVISVRIKGDDVDVLAAAAKAAGVPLSTYLRQSALAAARDTPPPAPVLDPATVDAVKRLTLGDLSEYLSGTEKGARAMRRAQSQAPIKSADALGKGRRRASTTSGKGATRFRAST